MLNRVVRDTVALMYDYALLLEIYKDLIKLQDIPFYVTDHFEMSTNMIIL